MLPLRVCVDVDDVDRAIAFFTEGLGLRVGRRFDRQWVEILGASAAIDLLANAEGTEATAEAGNLRTYRRHWTPVHLDFVVDDLDAAVVRAVAAGARLERPVREEVYGRLANLSDPFGNGICLLEMNARGYDALISA
jgi:predicted enzyme related to lactoylglutathione lyase